MKTMVFHTSFKKIQRYSSAIFIQARYNMKVIFANKFVWFVVASFIMLVLISIKKIHDGDDLSDRFIYNVLLLPGLLLVFYPTTFGIQNDLDSGILESLFGIPDYRYKVWLFRMVMVFVIVTIILIMYAVLSYILLFPANPIYMAVQLMFPVAFIGCLSFMLSTVIKNGNGTAVVIVILLILLLFFNESLERTRWNIFLNPYEIPRDMNLVIWKGILFENRIFLSVGTILFLLYGLFNLQKREKFL